MIYSMSKTTYGWTGKVLHIDLTTHEMAVQYPAYSIYEKHLGGRGLAGYFLRPYCTLEYNEPDLPILIFTGPLTGTDAPTSGRGTIMSRSPLTGAICDCSVGGRLATQLKKAGWDGIVITGHSQSPCGIEIRDESITVTNTSLWGMPTTTVFDTLQADPTAPSVATIGPAAENGARIASIIIDRHHTASRGGLGLVWAAKNLKYITVSGSKPIAVSDPTALAAAREEICRLTAASPALMGQHGIANRGTAAFFDLIDSRRMMPTDNFTKTQFDHASKLNANAYFRQFKPTHHACANCHIHCRKIASDGRTMPEYGAMAHFTALIGNHDRDRAIDGITLCNHLGLDPISAAATLACHHEITKEELTARTQTAMLYDMASGGHLGHGSLDFAQSCERPDLSMSVKGLELPAYDPRGAYGMALAYAVSTRGADHERAGTIGHEILRKPVATDRFSFSGKARIIKIGEDQIAAADALAVCRNIFFAASLEEYATAIKAVTGHAFSGQDMLTIGERIVYNERIMNALNGFDSCEDDLPSRFFAEAGTSGGGITIAPINRDEFLQARANYYTVRGLDPHGKPTIQNATRLGLELN